MSSAEPPHPHLRREVVHGVGWVIVEKWGVRLLTLIVFMVLTRTVAPEAFGLISLVSVFTAILSVFVDSGFSKSVIQKKSLTEADISTAFWTSITIGLVLYVGLFLSAPLIETAYDQPGLASVIRVMSIGLVLSSVSGVPAAIMEREMLFRLLSLRMLLGTVVGSVLAIVFALIGADVWALVIQSVATAVIATVALWVASTWRPRLIFSWTALRKMLGFGFSVLGIELLTTVQANIDKLLIGSILGTGPLGIYYVAQRLLNIVSELITSVLGKLALTTFSRLQEDLPRMRRGFLQLTFAAGAIAIPIFGTLALLSGDIIPYMFGTTWNSAVPIMQVLAVSAAFSSIAYFDKNILLASGNSGRAFTLAVVENIVGALLLVTALPFGLFVVAIARAARLIVAWPFRLYMLKRSIDLPLRPYIANVGFTLLAFVASTALFLLIAMTPWPRLSNPFWLFAVPVSLLILLTYGGMLWIICGSANRHAVRATLSILKRN